MKFNNKGMTLVELIVTFALLLVIVVGLYNLILEVKFEVDEKQIIKNTIEFSSLINNDIHYDLLHDKPFAIFIKPSKNEDWTCSKSRLGTCGSLDGNTISAIHNDSGKSFNRGKDLMEEKFCKFIYPCALYLYFDKNIGESGEIKVRGMALGSVNGATNGPVADPLGKINEENERVLIENGVLYGSYDWKKEIYDTLFEPVEPYDDKGYVEVRDGNNYVVGDDTSLDDLIDPEDKPYIKVEDGILKINYALYLVDDDSNYNYGFKIAYPFS